MKIERLTDPTKVKSKDIVRILKDGAHPVVQFSNPTYTPRLLRSVNDLCREHGARLEVRFYGHGRDGFDAGVLSALPDVQSLSADCLRVVHNEEHFWRLPHLRKLSFGAYEFDRPDFLSGFPLEQMQRLSLSENKKRNLDLAPLDRCDHLDDLFVNGHTKNIEVLANLPVLQTLGLNGISKKTALPFIRDIRGLRKLALWLGGRESLDEISHATVEDLTIIRVRGLVTLGDLSRFPALRRLHIEDQIKLEHLSLNGVSLREVFINNCKTLSQIDGLENQSQLEHLRLSQIDLELDPLVERDWPDSMTVLALYGKSRKWTRDARAKLDARGYREYSHR